MKKMSRAELDLHRQRQQVTFEERLRKEKLKANKQEAEVLGDKGDRAAGRRRDTDMSRHESA